MLLKIRSFTIIANHAARDKCKIERTFNIRGVTEYLYIGYFYCHFLFTVI